MGQALKPTSASGNGQLRESILRVVAARSELNGAFSQIALFGESHRHITAAIRHTPTEKDNTNLRLVGRGFRKYKEAFEKEARNKALELHDALKGYMIDTVRLKIAPSFAPIGVGVEAPTVGNNAVHVAANLNYLGFMPSRSLLWQAPVTEVAPGHLSPIRLQPERSLGTSLEQVAIPIAQFDTFRREAHKMTVVTLKAVCEDFAYEVLSLWNHLFERTGPSEGRAFRMLSGKNEGRCISVEMRQAGFQLVPIVNVGGQQLKMPTFNGALDYAISVGSEKSTGKQDPGPNYYNMDVGYD